MFRTIEDFLHTWIDETEATLKIFGALTDASLEQRVGSQGRTLGRIGWHIVQTLPEMGGRMGLNITGPQEEEAVPISAEQILAAFRGSAESLAAEIRDHWGDGDLEVEDDMYGEAWPRGRTLAILVAHQVHHRGQMTVLMRQAGLPVPGVYGPSREEWAGYGMPAQE